MLAKLKPFVEIPERFKCCPESILGLKHNQDKIIELKGKPFLTVSNCFACGTVFPEEPAYLLVGIVGEFPVSCMDIDEGVKSNG